MAQIIQDSSKDSIQPQIKTSLLAIQMILNSQKHTFRLQAQQPKRLVYREQSNEFPIDWFFKVIQKAIISIELAPAFEYAFGAPFKVGNQRILVDLLKIFSNKNPFIRWNVMVTQNNQIRLRRRCSCNQINKQFPLLFIRLKNQSKSIFNRLFIILQPYSFQDIPVHQPNKNQQVVTASPLEEVFSALVMFQARKLMRKSFQQADPENNYPYSKKMQNKKQEIFNFLNKNREKAFDQVSECLVLSKLRSIFIKHITPQKLKYSEMNFHKWSQQKKKALKSESKNVYGIKIVKQFQNKQQKKQQKTNKGSHCEVIIGKFLLIIMASLNASTNVAFESIPGAKNLTWQRELELARKQCLNENNPGHKNSFQNEIEFIQYIKDRSCKYISTYYWQVQKKKAEMKHIIMDLYPQNLRQTLQSQNFITLRMKITILMQISQALGWLTENHICHRDLKPQNIMLDASHIPKIIDFGSCCPVYLKGVKPAFSCKDIRLLASTTFCKKYKDLPQEMQKKYDKKVYEAHILFDVYSLGKVIQQTFHEQDLKIFKVGEYMLKYIFIRCLAQIAEERPTYQQIEFILYKSIEYLQKHSQSLL